MSPELLADTGNAGADTILEQVEQFALVHQSAIVAGLALFGIVFCVRYVIRSYKMFNI